MKCLWILVLLLATPAAALLPETPVATVDAQVAAFNRGDLEAFATRYADDVEIVLLGEGKTLVRGKQALLDYYRPLFAKYHPRAEVLQRITSGSFVSDRERVSAGSHAEEGLALYQIEGGRIRRVWITP